jgi:hypothetical protein
VGTKHAEKTRVNLWGQSAILKAVWDVTTAPTAALSITVQMTQPEMGTFVPPFTVGVPVSTSAPTFSSLQVRTHLNQICMKVHPDK